MPCLAEPLPPIRKSAGDPTPPSSSFGVQKWRRYLHPVAAFLTAGFLQLQAQSTFIPSGANWRFLDTGVALASDWRTLGFDDSLWPSGPAQLGYGDGDEATLVGYGPNASTKYITTYFRRVFTVPDPNAVAGLKLELLRDDGAVVYLNGTEVARSNLHRNHQRLDPRPGGDQWRG